MAGKRKHVKQARPGSTPWLSGLVVALPVALAILLPLAIFGKSILRFVPASSDEIIYWREIKTFSEHFFGGGQYSTNEMPARFAFSPFGSHGPAFTLLFGLIGSITGWHLNTGVILHLLMVPLSLYAALRIATPGPRQLAAMLCLALTWWPLQLYMASNMQETLHMCLAIVLAALFYRYLKATADRRIWLIRIAALLIFAMPFRFIWGFLFFPLVLFSSRSLTWRRWLAAAVVTAGALLAGVLFLQLFYSPYPWFSSELLATLGTNPRAALSMLWEHFISASGRFVSTETLPVVILARAQVLGLLLLVAGWAARAWRQKQTRSAPEIWLHAINLASVLGFVLLFYDVLDTRDYRMLIAPLLFSGMLFAFFQRNRLVYALVASNLLFLLPFLGYYAQLHRPNFEYDQSRASAFAAEVNSQVEFMLGADRWCNTISVAKQGRFNALSYPISGIDSGIGITTILDWKDLPEGELKAEYVLLDPDYVEAGFGRPERQFDLVPLLETSFGTLYTNPRSACER